MMTPFLSGLRVLDMTNERGALAGHMLAQLGADVVQVEPPAGSGARNCPPFANGKSLYWEAYGSGKRSVCCDLDDNKQRQTFLDLVKNADFFLESESPGSLEKLGLAYQDLKNINPRLIHVTITAFGSTGPKAHYADSDLVVWASGGYLLLSRDGENPPVRFSVPQAFLHAAADAVAGALIAHAHRNKTGRGQHVDVSAQQSTSITTLGTSLAAQVGHDDFAIPGSTPLPKPGEKKKLDLSGSGSRTRRPKWQLKDGFAEMHLGIGPAGGRFANNMIAWMASENAVDADIAAWDWVKLPERIQNDEVTDADMERAWAQVGAFLKQFTKAELLEKSIEKKLLLAPIMTTEDLLKSPHHQDRGFYQRTAGVSLPGDFALSSSGGFAALTPAPTVGAHSEEVIAEWCGGQSRSTSAPITATAPNPDKPLSDVKILDLAWVVAGPVIGRTLADFGARVIRVESSKRIETARMMGPFPGGKVDPQQSALYENCNAGKLGLTLDLNTEAGKDIVRDLVKWADVVVESFSPGQMANWGLGYDALKTIKPDLIMLSTSLMGQSGRYSRFSGYGNVGAAVSGFQGLVGWPGGQPFGPFGPYTDFVGPRFATAALLAALERRTRTGEGAWLDVSQAEAGIQFLAPYIADYSVTGNVAGLTGNRDTSMSPNGVFPCAIEAGEGEAWLALSVASDGQWRQLAGIIGGEQLASDDRFSTLPARKDNEDALEEIISRWTETFTASTLEQRLQAQGIAAHKVASTHDMAKDPQLAARGHFVHLPHPMMGDSVVESARFRLSESPGNPEFAAPWFGRDNTKVLSEILNYSDEKISKLNEAGVLV